jgi:hypothetical protein
MTDEQKAAAKAVLMGKLDESRKGYPHNKQERRAQRRQLDKAYKLSLLEIKEQVKREPPNERWYRF